MSHTPGPWTARESALSRSADLWFIDGQRPEEADMHGEARAPRVAEAWTDANAHLIAAAPDLLTAAKFALLGIETADIVAGSQKWRVERTVLEAAIAKAEGR